MLQKLIKLMEMDLKNRFLGNDKKLVRQDKSTPKMTRIGIQKYLVE